MRTLRDVARAAFVRPRRGQAKVVSMHAFPKDDGMPCCSFRAAVSWRIEGDVHNRLLFECLSPVCMAVFAVECGVAS